MPSTHLSSLRMQEVKQQLPPVLQLVRLCQFPCAALMNSDKTQLHHENRPEPEPQPSSAPLQPSLVQQTKSHIS